MAKQLRSTPVMQSVLDAVAARLLEKNESLIRIPEICEATGVNYGSVYHHFGSREGVIDAAYEMMFTQFVTEDVNAISSMGSLSSSKEEFIGSLRLFAAVVARGEERRARRNLRLRIVAMAATRPELRSAISEAQATLTSALRETIDLAVSNGWIDPFISSQFFAVIIQVIIFGRTLDDVSAAPLSDDEWADASERIILWLAGIRD